MEFDLLVFVGRFQPFHRGHQRVIDIALEKASKVLILLGSAGKARTIRNPFSAEERAQLIHNHYKHQKSRILIRPIYDKMYNDTAWIKQVQDTVHQVAIEVANDSGFPNNGYKDLKIGLIGASKDQSSYYLKLFPQWSSVAVRIKTPIHATYIRENYLDGVHEPWMWRFDLLPETSINFLKDFSDTHQYQQLQKEYRFVRNYKKSWEVAPYPVKHLTVDAVVEQSGHILLVKRRSEPGKGLLALPGGHVEEYEKLEDSMIRELREETKIKVPEPVLRGSIVKRERFDDPYRSTIGRVVTEAYHIKLSDQTQLPKVKGSDDAEKAFWMPVSDIKEDVMFDDHYHIIQYFLGV